MDDVDPLTRRLYSLARDLGWDQDRAQHIAKITSSDASRLELERQRESVSKRESPGSRHRTPSTESLPQSNGSVKSTNGVVKVPYYAEFDNPWEAGYPPISPRRVSRKVQHG